jgi:hypothetical protein
MCAAPVRGKYNPAEIALLLYGINTLLQKLVVKFSRV